MMRLAFRNLFHSKVRLAISLGGVALAFMLILSLDAVMTGSERQVTAYIDSSGADIFVSQKGVRNMHMAYSALPASVVSRVSNVKGVASATPILYLTNLVEIGDTRNLAYIIGLPEAASAGGPWNVGKGKKSPAEGEAIIDSGIAAKSGVGLGDTVKILGAPLRIAGLSKGTASLVSTVAFIAGNDFARLRGNADSVSFVLVTIKGRETPGVVAARIEAEVGSVTAQTRQAFAERERQVIRDMSTDLITIMNLVGFLIGLAVMALTVYTATLARRAEYGVLKAIGARNARLYGAVAWQAVLSVALGFALGLAFTFLLSSIAPLLGVNLYLEVSAGSLAKVALASLAIAVLSALLPIRQISGLDPAQVFRRR